MAKEELIQFEGLVLEALPDTRFRVQLDSGHEIVAYTAGKMKKNRIKTLAGDQGHGRNVALRSRKRTADLPAQGRARADRAHGRSAPPSAAADSVEGIARVFTRPSFRGSPDGETPEHRPHLSTSGHSFARVNEPCEFVFGPCGPAPE